MFGLTSFLTLVLCALAGVAIVCVGVRYFAGAVAMMLLSPWVASLFIPNNPQAEFYEGFGSFARMGLIVLLGVIGAIYFVKGLPLTHFRLPIPFLLLATFLLLALISTSYSIDPRYTLIRTTAFVAVFSFLIGFFRWVGQDKGIEKTLNLFFLVFSSLLLLNLLSLLVAPSKAWWWTAPTRFQGLAAHPNDMGSFLMLSYPILYWKLSSAESKRQQVLPVILIVIAILLHLLTGSRTTLLAAMLGSVVWLVTLKKTTILFFLTSVLGTVLLAGFITVGTEAIKPDSFDRGPHSSGIADLTGRPEFWAGSVFLINQRPLAGYGFAVEGRIWSDRRFIDPKLALWSGSAKTSLHNGYLSIAVGLGWVGLTIWLLTTMTPIWQLRKVKVDRCVALVLSILSMCLLVNLVESAVNGSRSILALTFWIMWAIAITLPRKSQSPIALQTP